MAYRVRGLDPQPFLELYGQPDVELAARGARRVTADRPAAFPDRIEMRDAEPGETLLLLNYTHQTADTPYRAAHAIFVCEGATTRYDAQAAPEVMRCRLLSLRAFNVAHEMTDADVVEGKDMDSVVERLLAAPGTAYLQAHYARRGCYAGLITRD